MLFWPGLNADIEALIKRCAVFQKYAYRQQSEPLMDRVVPEHAWYRVGLDIFQWAGKSYLCVVYVPCNFPEVELLRDTTTVTVVRTLIAVFARYRLPIEVCTDNGPQFGSHELALFAKKYDFKHITSSPPFPCSNGHAEKGVQIVKRIFNKPDRKSVV